MKKRYSILVTLILLLSFSSVTFAEEIPTEGASNVSLSNTDESSSSGDSFVSVVTLDQAPEVILSAAKSGMDYSLGYERISITHSNFVVDSLNGISAYYNPSGSGYDCAEYINRYYSSLYGIKNITSRLGQSYNGYNIVRTYNPKKGDIVYATASQRGKGYGHYAIVKSYENGVLTLIEQNWSWTSSGVRLAAKNRRIPFPTSSQDSYGQFYNTYYVYTVQGLIQPGEYKDVPSTHWAADYIYDLTDLNILGGNGDGTFTPDNQITRAELATILAKTAKINPDNYGGTSPFKDVKAGQWYASYVAWAYQQGIVTGYAGYFSPNDFITREDIATMLGRFAQKYYGTLPSINAQKKFADHNKISSYAESYVTAMQKANIIDGYEDNHFRPQNKATRAETAKMVSAMLTAVGK